MAKFKVGDIVKPNDKSVGWFAITRKGNMLEGVVVHSEDDWFSVKITKMAEGGERYEGLTFRIVSPECFDLVCRKRELHVTTDGTTTHAVLKEGGKVVKRAKAVCSPDDEYSFETGARLAVDRVFGKEAEKKEPTYKFNIGDVVTVVSPRRYSFAWSNAFIPLFGEKCLRRFARRGYPPEDCPYVVRQKAEWEDPFGKKVKMYVIEELHFPGLYGGAYHIVDEKGLVKQY